MSIETVLRAPMLRLVREFRAALRAAHIPVSSIILFGSRAKGNAQPWSDIDLCVVSTRFGKNRHTEMVCLGKIAVRVASLLEPIPYHPDDLADKFDPLAAEIRRYGKILPG